MNQLLVPLPRFSVVLDIGNGYFCFSEGQGGEASGRAVDLHKGVGRLEEYGTCTDGGPLGVCVVYIGVFLFCLFSVRESGEMGREEYVACYYIHRLETAIYKSTNHGKLEHVPVGRMVVGTR